MAHLAEHANRRILDASAKDMSHNGMGTTLTAAFIDGAAAHWVHVGDSRLYLFRDGVLVQVTDDHTLAGLLLGAGEISAEEARVHPARNMLMSCLGRCDFEADTGTLELLANDLLLLSTDGLHDLVPEQDIADTLGGNGSIEDKPGLLVEAALGAGGRDNITVVLVRM
jgi:protein phosphatase